METKERLRVNRSAMTQDQMDEMVGGKDWGFLPKASMAKRSKEFHDKLFLAWKASGYADKVEFDGNTFEGLDSLPVMQKRRAENDKHGIR